MSCSVCVRVQECEREAARVHVHACDRLSVKLLLLDQVHLLKLIADQWSWEVKKRSNIHLVRVSGEQSLTCLFVFFSLRKNLTRKSSFEKARLVIGEALIIFIKGERDHLFT